MTAPITGAELLDVAELLAAQDTPTRPRPGHRRRAISSAYYALFHELVGEAVSRAVGSGPERQAERDVVSRWYRHGDLRTVADWVVARSLGRKIPDPVTPLLADPSPDLVALADAFVILHDARQDADYSRSATVSNKDIRGHILTSRAALALLPRLAGDRGYENYLRLLLGGPRVATR
jgi:hypothetical protein